MNIKGFCLTIFRIYLQNNAFLGMLQLLKNFNTCSLQKWIFWRSSFYPANHSNLKSFLKTLIGWKKAGPPK